MVNLRMFTARGLHGTKISDKNANIPLKTLEFFFSLL